MNEHVDNIFDDLPDSNKHYYICVNIKNVVKYYSLYEFNEALPHNVMSLLIFNDPVATVEVIPNKYHKISKMKVVFGQEHTWHLTEKNIKCVYYEK